MRFVLANSSSIGVALLWAAACVFGALPAGAQTLSSADAAGTIRDSLQKADAGFPVRLGTEQVYGPNPATKWQKLLTQRGLLRITSSTKPDPLAGTDKYATSVLTPAGKANVSSYRPGSSIHQSALCFGGAAGRTFPIGRYRLVSTGTPGGVPPALSPNGKAAEAVEFTYQIEPNSLGSALAREGALADFPAGTDLSKKTLRGRALFTDESGRWTVAAIELNDSCPSIG